MPGQENRTANSWGRRRVLERASERAVNALGAESVATVGAAHARALRTSPLLRFASSSPSHPGCLLLLLWYLPLPLFLSVAQQLRSPSPTVPLSHRSPSPSSPPSRPSVRCSSRALRSLAPRPHRVYVSHSLYLYMCSYASMYRAHTTPYTVTVVPASYRCRRCASMENKIGALTTGQRWSR